jgi:hypothetical protein
MPQAGRGGFRSSIKSLKVLSVTNYLSRNVNFALAQPLTDLSTRNLLKGKSARRVRLTYPSVSRFARKYVRFEISQP